MQPDERSLSEVLAAFPIPAYDEAEIVERVRERRTVPRTLSRITAIGAALSVCAGMATAAQPTASQQLLVELQAAVRGELRPPSQRATIPPDVVDPSVPRTLPLGFVLSGGLAGSQTVFYANARGGAVTVSFSDVEPSRSGQCYAIESGEIESVACRAAHRSFEIVAGQGIDYRTIQKLEDALRLR